MKRFFSIILSIVVVSGFYSCSTEDRVEFVAQPDPEGVAITSTLASTYDLTELQPEDVVETLEWNAVEFGLPTNVNYEVQASLTENFSKFEPLGRTQETHMNITAQQLIKLTEEAELDENDMTTIYFRVVSSAGTAGELAQFSPVESIAAVIPTEEEYVNLYMVGDASAAGWAVDNNNTPLFRDPQNLDQYYYTGKLGAGSLKFLETTAWAPQYGSAGDGVLVARPTEADPDPAAISIPSAGYYAVVVNLEDMTYSVTPAPDAADAEVYGVIGLVGSATVGGWSSDVLLAQSTFNPHIWYADDVVLTDGAVKFRANQDWAVNWGSTTFPSGLATNGGPDIPAVEGVYDVWFNDLTGRYVFIEEEPAE